MTATVSRSPRTWHPGLVVRRVRVGKHIRQHDHIIARRKADGLGWWTEEGFGIDDIAVDLWPDEWEPVF